MHTTRTATDIENMLAAARTTIRAADSHDELTEAIADLLDDWYAAWPAEAVTDPHEPIARELASILTEELDRADARAAATRQMAIDANAALRRDLLAALACEDDGRTALADYVAALRRQRDESHTELAQLRDDFDQLAADVDDVWNAIGAADTDSSPADAVRRIKAEGVELAEALDAACADLAQVTAELDQAKASLARIDGLVHADAHADKPGWLIEQIRRVLLDDHVPAAGPGEGSPAPLAGS